MLITVLTTLQAGREVCGHRRLVTDISFESTAVSSFLHTRRFVQNTAPSWHCIMWEYSLFLALREESRLTVFENRVLRRIFGSRREELTGS
jgi:hypothetical protein